MENYEIRENQQYKSREIIFSGKPGEAVRDALKGLKCRWNGARGLWYGYATAEAIREAIENAQNGQNAQQNGTESGEKPARRQNGKPAQKLAPLWDRVQVSALPDYGTENEIKKAIREKCAATGWGYDRAAADYFRRHLRERFPEVKFSVTSGGSGWLDKCDIEIISSPYAREIVKGDPSATDSRERYDRKENSPALDAVLDYCVKLHDAADADDGDIYADYGPRCDLYGRASISWDYTQKEPTPEQSADIADFERKKAEHDEAERAAERERMEAERKEQERAAKEYEEAARKAAEIAQQIRADVVIEDFPESEQFAVLGMIEAAGKSASLEEADKSISELNENGKPVERRRLDAVISRKVTFRTHDLFREFCRMFNCDFDFLNGKGATETQDPRVSCWDDYIKLTQEQRETVKTYTADAVAVYDAAGTLQFVIDPQGYSYARYVLRPDVEKGESPEIMPAPEYREKRRTEAEALPPFYVPAPLAEQIESAQLQNGETVTVLTVNEWLCYVQQTAGTLTEATAQQYAQYNDAARFSIVPNGKRKETTMNTHSGSEFLMYRGIIPEIPAEMRYKRISENMSLDLQSGSNAGDFIRNVRDYLHGMGIDPVINTIPA